MTKIILPSRKVELPQRQEEQLSTVQKMVKNVMEGFKSVGNIGVGVAKTGLETLRGASSLGERGIRTALEPLGLMPKEQQTAAEKLIPESAIEAKNASQSVGKFAGDVGLFLLPSSKIAKIEKVLSVRLAPQLGKSSPLISRALTEAFAAAGITATQEGEIGKEAGIAGAIGAAIPVVGSGLKQAKRFATSTTAQKAVRSGLSEQDITALTRDLGLSDDLGRKMLTKAQEATRDRAKSSAFHEFVGKPFKTIRASIKGHITITGKKIGDIVDEITESKTRRLNVDDLRDGLIQDMKRLGVKITDEGLNTKNSQIEGLASEESMINFLWNKVKPIQKGLKSRNLTGSQIVNINRNISTKLYKGAKEKQFTVTQGIAEKIRKGLRKKIDDLADTLEKPELRKFNKDYHDLLSIREKINKRTQRGERSTAFLRRLFGNVDEVPRELVNEIEEMSKRFGIKEGKDLFKKADLALTAERAAGFEPPRGAEGVIKSALGGKIGFAREAYDKIRDAFTGKKAENFIKIIDEEILKKKVAQKLTSPERRELIESIIFRIFGQ